MELPATDNILTDDRLNNRESVNSFFIGLISAILLICGICCVYSACLPYYEHQIINSFMQWVVIGFAVSALFVFINGNALRTASSCLILLWIALNILEYISIVPQLNRQLEVSSVFFISALFISTHSAGKSNQQIKVPTLVFITLVLSICNLIIWYKAELLYSLFYIGFTVLILVSCSVSFSRILTVFMFMLLPVVFLTFSDEVKTNQLISYLVPGYFDKNVNGIITIKRKCLEEASMLGKGIAMGSHKNGILPDIASSDLLCNIAEETGFAGIFTLLLMYLALGIFGYRVGIRNRHVDSLNSCLANSMTTFFVCKYIVNILSVIGYIPANTVSLPLIGGSPSLCLDICCCSLLLKCSMAESRKFREKEKGEIDSIIKSYEA